MKLGALAMLTAAATAAADPLPASFDRQMFCNVVASQALDPSGDFGRYKYQRMLAEAASVSPSDEPQQAARKIHDFWGDRLAGIHCNSINFNVNDGNVLKYAASNGFDQFIYDALSYRLNVSQADKSDGLPLEGYLRQEIERTRANHLDAAADKYQQYLDLIEAHGAGKAPKRFYKYQG